MVRCMLHRENCVTTPPPRALARSLAYGDERGRRPGKIGVQTPDNRHHAIEHRKLYPAQSSSLQQLTVKQPAWISSAVKSKKMFQNKPGRDHLICQLLLRISPTVAEYAIKTSECAWSVRHQNNSSSARSESRVNIAQSIQIICHMLQHIEANNRIHLFSKRLKVCRTCYMANARADFKYITSDKGQNRIRHPAVKPAGMFHGAQHICRCIRPGGRKQTHVQVINAPAAEEFRRNRALMRAASHQDPRSRRSGLRNIAAAFGFPLAPDRAPTQHAPGLCQRHCGSSYEKHGLAHNEQTQVASL